MTWELLIARYGYLVIFSGMFLEGEAVVIMGALLAHRGDLELPLVIVAAFLGAWTVDHCFFFFGRLRGRAFLEKRPLWQAKSGRVLDLLHRHQNLLMLGMRFFFGFRTVAPFMVGVSGVKVWKFSLLNGIGAVVWATSFGILGFFIGNTLQMFIKELQRYESALALIVGVVGVSCWGILIWSHRRGRKRAEGGDTGSVQDG